MPRGVLWTALDLNLSEAITATDPLTVALKNRAQWANGNNLPEGASPNAMCAMVDQGFKAEASQAVTELAGGMIRLARVGADWSVAEFIAPKTPVTGTCD
jgi:hypothetical protein